ncbi:MAG: hypothetical protein ACRDHX_11625 [Chloroflexota bacterium]
MSPAIEVQTPPPRKARHTKTPTRAKIAVTVPRDLLARAHKLVQAGVFESMSGLMSDALKERLDHTTLEAIFAEWDAEDGGFTEEHRDWARRVLGV